MTDQNETQNENIPPTEAQASAAAPETAKVTEEKKAGAEDAFAEQLAAARKEAADNRQHYLRAMADLDNYRKRAAREKDEVRQYGAAKILEDLMPVLDNLTLGIGAAKQPGADPKTIVNGVEMVLTQFKGALANHGLKEVSALGQPFDPHQHEAISHLASPDVPAEHVLVVVRTGYTLNGRLLRPASVVVSSGAPAPEAEQKA